MTQSPLGETARVRGISENGKVKGVFITFWGKKVTCEATMMPQNIIKDKNLYKILGTEILDSFGKQGGAGEY